MFTYNNIFKIKKTPTYTVDSASTQHVSNIAAILAMVCVEHFGGRLTTLVGGLLAASGLILGSQVNDLNLMYCTLGFLPGKKNILLLGQ